MEKLKVALIIKIKLQSIVQAVSLPLSLFVYVSGIMNSFLRHRTPSHLPLSVYHKAQYLILTRLRLCADG